MKKYQMEISLAIAAMLAVAGVAKADSTTNQSNSPSTASLNATSTDGATDQSSEMSDLTTVSLDDTTSAPVDTHPLLMYSLDKVQAGDSTVGQNIQNANINITGYIDVGYTADLSGRNSTLTGAAIPGRTFDSNYGNHIDLNQLDLQITRSINFTDPGFRNRGWDIGGEVEWLYGYDADFVQSNGLNFYHSWTNNVVNANNGTLSPLYQFTLEQAFVQVAFALGDKSALQVQAGKFDTLIGYESIDATSNPFYSHSFIFNYSGPFTNTGVMLLYNPDATSNVWVFQGGITEGWNQTLKNLSGSVDFMGQINWTPTSEWNLVLNFITGPEQGGTISNAPGSPTFQYPGYYTTVLDFLTHYTPAWNSNLDFGNEMVWGIGYNGAGNNLGGGFTNPPGTPGGTVNWFGDALYQSYTINSYLTWNNREEYYYDGAGFTTAGLGQTNPTLYTAGTSISYGEVTTGFKITPFPNDNLGQHLYLRPELREDLADHAVLTNGKHYQTTAAIDVIYQF
jgi:Putative beta-barrel porin-2, OmpL-like. bbp2